MNKIRGPEAEWVDSHCPLCGDDYFGAALEYAQRLHDEDRIRAKKCTGRLQATSDPTPEPTVIMMKCYCLYPGCGVYYEIGALTEDELLEKYAKDLPLQWHCSTHAGKQKRRRQMPLNL